MTKTARHKQSEFEKRLQIVINQHYQGDWNKIAEIMKPDDKEPRVYKIIRLCEAAGVNPDAVFFEVNEQ